MRPFRIFSRPGTSANKHIAARQAPVRRHDRQAWNVGGDDRILHRTLFQQHVGQAALHTLDIKSQTQRGKILGVQIHQQHSQAPERQIGGQIDGCGGLGSTAFHRD